MIKNLNKLNKMLQNLSNCRILEQNTKIYLRKHVNLLVTNLRWRIHMCLQQKMEGNHWIKNYKFNLMLGNHVLILFKLQFYLENLISIQRSWHNVQTLSRKFRNLNKKFFKINIWETRLVDQHLKYSVKLI